MKKVKLFSLIGTVCFLATGCSAVSDSTSNQVAAQVNGDTSMEKTVSVEQVNDDASTENAISVENATLNVDSYSLTGESLVQKTEEADISDVSTEYVVYTDNAYDYYFDTNMTILRYAISTGTFTGSTVIDTSALIEQATKYIEQINVLDGFTDEDWVVDETADGLYTLDLYQTVYGENISVATVCFIGEELYSVILETDVIEYEDAGTKLIDREAAVEQAESLLVTAYGDTYTNYVDDLDDDATTVALNVHGGDLYWYVKINNGEYGGFVAEINAVTGECNYVDQSK